MLDEFLFLVQLGGIVFRNKWLLERRNHRLLHLHLFLQGVVLGTILNATDKGGKETNDRYFSLVVFGLR